MRVKGIIFVVIVLVLANAVSAANIYIKPQGIELVDIFVDSVAEKEITLSVDEEGFIVAIPSVTGEIAEFTTLDITNPIKISKDRPRILRASFSTVNLELKEYIGEIKFIFRNPTSPDITPSEVFFSIPVRVVVTDQKKEQINVKDIKVSTAEQGDFIDILINLENKGNIKSQLVVDAYIDNEKNNEIIEILPFEDKKAVVSINSNGFGVGLHNAKVDVLFNSNVLKSHSAEFNILEQGSLIRNGELLYILNKDVVHAGDSVLFEPVFVNNGEKSVYAKFKGEVLFNFKKVGEIESEEVYVASGESARLKFKYIPTLVGQYTINGKGYYGSSVTDEKSTTVNTRPAGEDIDVVPLGASPLLILILIVTSLFVFREILKKKLKGRIKR